MRDQIQGKAEEWKGKLTGDKALEMKGKARQHLGDAKAKARDVKEDLRQAWERRYRGDENPEPRREPGPEQP